MKNPNPYWHSNSVPSAYEANALTFALRGLISIEWLQAKLKYRRMFETRKVPRHDKFRKELSQHKNKNRSQIGHDQVSGGVSVLCWLAAPVAMFYGNLRNLVIRSKSVIISRSVISSQTGVMSDELKVPLYIVIYQNVM